MKVADDYRTNPKSHQPGGVTVRVVFKNGDFRDYDRGLETNRDHEDYWVDPERLLEIIRGYQRQQLYI